MQRAKDRTYTPCPETLTTVPDEGTMSRLVDLMHDLTQGDVAWVLSAAIQTLEVEMRVALDAMSEYDLPGKDDYRMAWAKDFDRMHAVHKQLVRILRQERKKGDHR